MSTTESRLSHVVEFNTSQEVNNCSSASVSLSLLCFQASWSNLLFRNRYPKRLYGRTFPPRARFSPLPLAEFLPRSLCERQNGGDCRNPDPSGNSGLQSQQAQSCYRRRKGRATTTSTINVLMNRDFSVLMSHPQLVLQSSACVKRKSGYIVHKSQVTSFFIDIKSYKSWLLL